ELGSVGGAAVTHPDIDKPINKIRKKPLAKEAEDKCVMKTTPLLLHVLPRDPERDISVGPLLWDIRRERPKDMTFEHSRFADLKRWGKLQYMDTQLNPDLLAGGWVNFPVEAPEEIKTTVSVMKLNGQVEVFNPADPDSP